MWSRGFGLALLGATLGVGCGRIAADDDPSPGDAIPSGTPRDAPGGPGAGLPTQDAGVAVVDASSDSTIVEFARRHSRRNGAGRHGRRHQHAGHMRAAAAHGRRPRCGSFGCGGLTSGCVSCCDAKLVPGSTGGTLPMGRSASGRDSPGHRQRDPFRRGRGAVKRRGRLGGILSFYHRDAA